jgi:diaminopimelate decarboxylase
MIDAGAAILDTVKSEAGDLKTPCFVYHPRVIAERHRQLRHLLGTPLVTSLKACAISDLPLRLLEMTNDDGWEVASLGELALVTPQQPKHCYVTNPSMTEPLMQAAIGAGAQLVLDSPDQVDRLLGMSSNRKPEPVLLRANGSVVDGFCADAQPCRPDHFGMDWPTLAAQALRLRAAGIAVGGLHVFQGSNMFERRAFWVVEAIASMIADLEARLDTPLRFVNLGGGFETRWEDGAFDFAAYRTKLAGLPRHIVYAHETGRAIFAAGGAFVTRVVARKRIGERTYFVCDGGLAQAFLLCGTENRFARRRAPTRIALGTAGDAPGGGLVVGSSCSQDDVIGEIPASQAAPAVGDLLVFDDCGAYHATYPMNNFLGLPPAASYVLP